MARLAIDGGTPVRKDFLIFGSPDVGEAEAQAAADVVRSCWLGTGPKVTEFEGRFAGYVGSARAMAVNSCTAALHLGLLACGIGPGDEVIVPAMTFCSTANVVFHAGATPVFADVDPDTMCLSVASVREKLTPRTRAIIPVHFAGRMCQIGPLTQIAKERGLFVIEDCAHAIETTLDGRHAGTFGDVGCFSFYATKNLVTGEGGMVVAEREDFAGKVKEMALHGLSRDAWKRFSDEGYKHYRVMHIGYKYNMMDMQAAIGLLQLEKLERSWLRRDEIWKEYDRHFSALPVKVPAPVPENERHARHLYTLLLDVERLKADRDTVITALHAEGIGVGVHYLALNLHPVYQDKLGVRKGDFPASEWISERTLSLPLSSKLGDRDVHDVIEAVGRVLRAYTA